MRPMFTYTATCLPEWTDYNGHMNDALYGRVFSDGVDAMLEEVGLNAAYRAETKGTIYTVEDHRWYEAEVHEGATLRVETHILDSDVKRIHTWQGLYVGDQRCAVCETMLLHISQAGAAPKTAPLPENVMNAVRAAQNNDLKVQPISGCIKIRKYKNCKIRNYPPLGRNDAYCPMSQYSYKALYWDGCAYS